MRNKIYSIISYLQFYSKNHNIYLQIKIKFPCFVIKTMRNFPKGKFLISVTIAKILIHIHFQVKAQFKNLFFKIQFSVKKPKRFLKYWMMYFLIKIKQILIKFASWVGKINKTKLSSFMTYCVILKNIHYINKI